MSSGRRPCIRYGPELVGRVRVGFARQPPVSAGEEQDDGRGREARDLEKDEHQVATVDGYKADE